MAKKKPAVVIPETTPDETIIETPEIEQSETKWVGALYQGWGDTNPIIISEDAKFHATFTPTWRTEIDCGDHDSVEAAQTAIVETAKEFDADVILGWHRESPVVWLASGHDGQVDTNLTIAKIVQVG